MKKYFAFIMVLMFSFTLSGSIAETKRTEDYIYEKKGSGIRILSYTGNESDVLIVPEEIDGLPVKIIGKGAFGNNTVASEIILPETLVTVESSAFNAVHSNKLVFSETRSKLTIETQAIMGGWVESVSFPSTVYFKRDIPFGQLNRLKSISVSPESTTYEMINKALVTKKEKKLIAYPLGAVEDETLIIPDGVKIIKESVFVLIKTAKTVIIPDSVIELENNCFADGQSIENLEIGAGIKKWGNRVFSGCHNLKTVSIHDGLKSIGKGAFIDCNSIEVVAIPASVTNIGKDAFKGNYTVKFIAEENSAAGKYAKKNGLELVVP